MESAEFWKACFEELKSRIELSRKILSESPADPMGLRTMQCQLLTSLPVGIEEVVERKLHENFKPLPEIPEVRYLTDDRDADEDDQNELVIMWGGNGDWYVSVVPKGTGTVGRAARICCSGGASSNAPGLTSAIAAAYRAIKNKRV